MKAATDRLVEFFTGMPTARSELEKLAKAGIDVLHGSLTNLDARLQESKVTITEFADISGNAVQDFGVKVVTAQDHVGQALDATNVEWHNQSLAISLAGDAAVAAADKTALALSKTFAETLKAEKQANEFDLAWAKIEQQDRNLVFKLNADIAIAQIQQGTELLKAAFQSVDEGIKATEQGIVELAKAFANVQSGAKASELEHLLEDQNRRQQQEFDLQKQLTDAQIAYLNAVTDRLNSGDATIQIDTTGVEPILRELLFSVMKQVQIKASSEAQLLLLGLT